MNTKHAQYYTQNYMIKFLKMVRPFNQGIINTPDGEKIAFAEFGNRRGKPVIHIHGGPGGFSQPLDLAFFDLNTQRVILYDQRHCMNSKTKTDWKTKNTTELLVQDLEQLRSHLNLNTFSILAGSWGSTLGLCYAIKHPERVDKQIYWGILLGRKSCVDFIAPELLSPMEKFYCDHNFFLEENYIMNNLDKIKNHPIAITHGDEDNICNYQNAIELTSGLNNAEIFIAQGEAHHPYMPKLAEFLLKKGKEL